jgi:two-component system sensor histidine kinase QseC
VEPLPKRLTRYTHGFWSRSDEFSSLLSSVQKLIDRINLNYKLTRSWTLQMAHELKTPLAIVRAETEAKTKAKLLPPAYSEDVIKEVQQMSEIISQFLEWAELENSQLQKDLHALRIKAVVKTVAARLNKISPDRIRLELGADFPVFANPHHLDQLISNLMTNALKFSPSSEQIEVLTSEDTLIIRDRGVGIPTEVQERIGEPFNIGSHEDDSPSGNGLGLAWVLTVAKLYQWKFELQTGANGTEVRIRFPKEETE